MHPNPMPRDTTLRIVPATARERVAIEAMMDPYLADLGGVGPYPRLERYWTEASRFPYLLYDHGQVVGFALVRRLDNKSHYELVEFYIDRLSRGQGLGRQAARTIFNSHIGTWFVAVRRDNIVGQRFWGSLLGNVPSVTISEATAPDRVSYQFISPIS